MRPLLVWLLFCLSSVVCPVKAYEVETHIELSAAAALGSVLGDNDRRSRLGLTKPISSGEIFPNSRGVPSTVIDLFRSGARYEDDFPRSMNHFFDPRTGTPLQASANDFYFITLAEQKTAEALISSLNSLAQTSPDWALAATLAIEVVNDYSYKAAREYFHQGLTAKLDVVRYRNLGLMFESLGRIIHHIQDMAQPQHVRNDWHLHDLVWEQNCELKTTFKCDEYKSLRRPSAYEHWINRDDVLSKLSFRGYEPVYAASGAGADGLTVFSDARRFWTNGGKGIADFTARNFLSAGTLSRSPPSVGPPFDMSVAAVCTGAVPPCDAPYLPDDVVMFFPNTVDDQFRAATLTNPYAAGLSVFDPEFMSRTGTRLLTVNRFTFFYDQNYLLPRAVGYSAGLINYFFRGDMEISPPDEGVYAIVDQRPGACGNACSFSKLKLKLRNVTPGNEAMGSGTLQAVAKFHRNNCYRADLAGEFGGDPAIFWGSPCRSPREEIVTSIPFGVAEVGSDQPRLITFEFDDFNTIPINATDMFLQVVFRGKLGQEDDAVAVTTKDIAEPNFLAVANMTDYVYDDVGNTGYHLIPYANAGSTQGVSNFGVAFGTNTTPVVTIPGFGGGQHAQIAFLTDVGDLPATIFFSGIQDTSWILQPEEFKLDDVTQKFERSCKVFLARGLYREYQYWFYQRVSDHTLSWKIQNVGSGGRSSKSDGDGKLRMHPEAAHDCGVQTGGVYDYSTMTPFTPTSALPWTINF